MIPLFAFTLWWKINSPGRLKLSSVMVAVSLQALSSNLVYTIVVLNNDLLVHTLRIKMVLPNVNIGTSLKQVLHYFFILMLLLTCGWKLFPQLLISLIGFLHLYSMVFLLMSAYKVSLLLMFYYVLLVAYAFHILKIMLLTNFPLSLSLVFLLVIAPFIRGFVAWIV